MISFSFNWNNKLDCSAFTTIRLDQPNKYRVGDVHEITIKGESKGEARIESIKRFMLADLNEFIARLDTGYSVEECRNIIIRMYPKVDFTRMKLMLILLVKTK